VSCFVYSKLLTRFGPVFQAAARVARRDATLYLGAIIGRPDRPGPSASVSNADVGGWVQWGFPLGVDMQGREATGVARRDATLYLGAI